MELLGKEYRKCVEDNEPRIRVLAHKLLKLRVEAVAELLRSYGKVQIRRTLHAEHPVHALLKALVAIFEREI